MLCDFCMTLALDEQSYDRKLTGAHLILDL